MIEGGLIVAGALAFVIGLLSFLQQRRNPLVFFFFLTTIGAAVWSAGIALFLLTKNPSVMVAAAVLYYVAAALIALSAILIGYSLRYGKVPKDGIMMLLVAPFLMVSIPIAIYPGILLGSVTVDTQNTATLVLTTYVLYGLYFIVYYSCALLLLYSARKKVNSRWKTSYSYLFAAFLLSGLIGMWFNLILPALGNYSLIWAGPLSIFPFLTIVYLAIIRYGLFDLRLALSRMTTYVLSVFAIAVIYVGLYYGIMLAVSKWVIPDTEIGLTSINLTSLVLILVLVLTFQPIRRFFDRITNSIFYRNRYSRENFFASLSSVLADSIELQPMLRRAATLISDTLSSDQVFFAIPDNRRILSVGTKGSGRLARADYDWIAEWHSHSDTADRSLIIHQVIDANQDDRELARILRSYGVQMVLLLRRGSDVRGMICIGERRSGRYTPRDFSVLETIADELTIAVQNALSLREVKLLNDTLQQRIDEATKELRQSNSQLRRLDEAKDEFISMASHQLRTPLTSIKGYIDMMLDGDAGKITPMQEKFLTEAYVSSERMVHLINDFLNVSRLQTGKFIIDKRPVDLAKIVEQELESLEVNASGRDLEFVYSFDKKIPQLMLDEAKVRQVVMNFADNAIYYSRPGTKIKVALTKEGDSVQLTVKDTGIGVPADEQSKLFTKFFRAANARKHRPDGTGVGLYLAKRVVLGHGGEIVFSSTEGKGSTFGFKLPLKKLEAKDKSN